MTQCICALLEPTLFVMTIYTARVDEEQQCPALHRQVVLHEWKGSYSGVAVEEQWVCRSNSAGCFSSDLVALAHHFNITKNS